MLLAAERRFHPCSDAQRLGIAAALADYLDANRQAALAGLTRRAARGAGLHLHYIAVAIAARPRGAAPV
jgi:hypothetical protein